MRVLVTASRDWADERFLWSMLSRATAAARAAGEPIVLVHGGARGGDAMADRWGRQVGCLVRIYPADWARYGRRAGFVRNAEMVASKPDVCLAFIHNHSPGATMCAQLAESQGIKTWRYREA